MNLHIFIANRLIKIVGHLCKYISYLFHWVFPKKRFTIPERSGPIIRSKRTSFIPKVVWQTNYTSRVTLAVYLNYCFNRLMALTYEFRWISDEFEDHLLTSMEQHVTKETIAAFCQIDDGAARADLWRAIILCHVGGVYIDVDANLVWPLSCTLPSSKKELFMINKQGYTNYFMASSPGNETLKKTIDIVVGNIQARSDLNVFQLTGPDTLIQAIGDKAVNSKYYRYVAIQGNFTNEHFQYMDKPNGKWTHKKNDEILKK